MRELKRCSTKGIFYKYTEYSARSNDHGIASKMHNNNNSKLNNLLILFPNIL